MNKIVAHVRRSAPIALGVGGLVFAVFGLWTNLSPGFGLASQDGGAEEAGSVNPGFLIQLPDFGGYQSDTRVQRSSELDTDVAVRSRVHVLLYTVQTGDSVFGIADKFDLAPETILWGNYNVLNDDPHLLRPGQELTILPVDGMYYEWQEGDSLESVAIEFDADLREILEWPGNELDLLQPEILPGEWIIIPDGRREFQQWLVPTIARGQAGVGNAFGPGGCSGDFSGGAVGSGGFIWPAANHTISGNDYWSGHLAIDIAAGTGTPIWAADTGVVVFAGWAYGGYGNMVMVDHGNGWQTLYAHLNLVSVVCGQNVSQGQILGQAGSTGNSTGPHLHFETRFNGGFVNPWFVLP
jgi:murein DD-endopeptidase MepM/ murein hydrolase activator NlpD